MLTFPSMSVTSPNLILSGWMSGLALLCQKAGLIRRLRLSLPVFSISLVKTASNWEAKVSNFSDVVTDLVFIPPLSLETKVG